MKTHKSPEIKTFRVARNKFSNSTMKTECGNLKCRL